MTLGQVTLPPFLSQEILSMTAVWQFSFFHLLISTFRRKGFFFFYYYYYNSKCMYKTHLHVCWINCFQMLTTLLEEQNTSPVFRMNSETQEWFESQIGSSPFPVQPPNHQTVHLVGTQNHSWIQCIFRRKKISFKKNNALLKSDILSITFTFSTKYP